MFERKEKKRIVRLKIIASIAIILVVSLILFAASTIDWSEFFPEEHIEPPVCTDAECIKENTVDCIEATYSIQEYLHAINSVTEATVIGKEGKNCIITLELKELDFIQEEPTEETQKRIHNAISQYLNSLERQKAACLFEPQEAEKTDFSNTSFLLSEKCTGELKESFLELDLKINEIIERESS